MTQAIIFARVTSQHSHIDTKIDNLVTYVVTISYL